MMLLRAPNVASRCRFLVANAVLILNDTNFFVTRFAAPHLDLRLASPAIQGSTRMRSRLSAYPAPPARLQASRPLPARSARRANTQAERQAQSASRAELASTPMLTRTTA